RPADPFGAGRRAGRAVHPHRETQGRIHTADRAASRAPQCAAADDHGPGTRSRLPHGRYRRRRGGLRVSRHGPTDHLRGAEPRRAAAPDVRGGGGCGVCARDLHRRPCLRVARPADPLLVMWRSPALAVGGTILAVVIATSLAAPWIVPYPTTEQHML